MTLNFCTLFNSRYLSRGVVMLLSLFRSEPDSRVFVFCFDTVTYNTLSALALNGVTLISLEEFEDEALLKVKPTRSFAEYCWTSTSSTILYCLNNFDIPHCTYIDADMFFYSSPTPLIEEMVGDSILLTEHAYTPAFSFLKRNGIYCVQFMCFKNDERGREALLWWRERCLEWCYARREDGKFGDQKYLDDWTTRFKGVCVSKNIGAGVAPWNVGRFEVYTENRTLTVRDKKTNEVSPIVFYHYHYLRFYTNGKVDFGVYPISKAAFRCLYKPYTQAILQSGKTLSVMLEEGTDIHGVAKPKTLLDKLRGLLGYNQVSLKKILK